MDSTKIIPTMNKLDILARKYGTDKRTNNNGENIYHGYTDIYYEYLKDKTTKYKNILEIGVREGWSHMMWYEFFPDSMIYGIDNFLEINPSKKEEIENDRIKILIADQTDEEKINEFLKNIELDMIIDDGSHMSWHQQQSFRFLFPKLKHDGYYFIEDLAVCYDRRFRELDDFHSSTLGWIELMCNKIPFSYYINEEEMNDILINIKSISLVGELCTILKV